MSLLKDKMGLTMKNFNILGVHWKIRFLGEGLMKNQYKEGDCWKWGPWTFCWVKGKGAWQERGGVFEGRGLIPQCTLLWICTNLREFVTSLVFYWVTFICFSSSSFLCSSVSGCSSNDENDLLSLVQLKLFS